MIRAIPSMFPRGAERVHVVRDNETETWRSDYTEREIGVPQILLVEQPVPGSAILPHYHSVDQFQIFLEGRGKLGHHDIAPLAIHYANRFTGYGPIVAGEHGMSYYVVRPSFAHDGSFYLHTPEARERLKSVRSAKRILLANNLRVATESELARQTGAHVERVIQPRAGEPDDGVFADIVTMGPGARYRGPEPAIGGGQVVLVVAGAAVFGGKALGLRSSIVVTPEELAVELAAGPGGLQALVLQYPRLAAKD